MNKKSVMTLNYDFSRDHNSHFKLHKVLCILKSTSSGSLQDIEGAAGEVKGALGYWNQLISSTKCDNRDISQETTLVYFAVMLKSIDTNSIAQI